MQLKVQTFQMTKLIQKRQKKLTTTKRTFSTRKTTTYTVESFRFTLEIMIKH